MFLFFFAVCLLFKIEKSFIFRFLFKIFDFPLYTSLGDIYILNPPPKCQQTVKRGSNLARQAVRGALIGLNLSCSEQNRMGCLQTLPER